MSKCEVIAVANQKGGVGKTTTTFTLGVALAKLGKKVLLIDADPQGDLTTCMGWHNPDDIPDTLASLMESSILGNEINTKEVILHHNENVDLIPSNIELSPIEVSLVKAKHRETIMKQCLTDLKENYDYILIDCMPSLGLITVNALASADKVIIPVQSQFLAAKGMNHLMSSILKIRQGINPNLKIEGILFNIVDGRTKLTKEITKELTNTYGKVFKVFNSVIPKTTKIAEASKEGKSIFLHDKRNKGALAYENLAKEVINNGRERTKSSKANIQSR